MWGFFKYMHSLFDRNVSHILDTRIVHKYNHSNPLWIETLFESRALALYFEDTWHYVVYIGFFYLLMVHLLKKFMEKRAPFHLKRPLFVWNLCLAIFSIVGAIRCSEEFFYTLATEGYYTSLCLTFDYRTTMARWCMYFSVSKIFELIDTLFLVLRKRPLSFLHCWHHFSVMIYAFHSGSEFMASSRWFMWMNFVAHSFMYSYFAIMSLGFKVPKSVAKFITLMQIAQMIVGVNTTLTVYYIKTHLGWLCQQTYANIYLSFVIYGSYMILFINYFVQTYVIKDKKKKRVVSTKKD